MPVLDTSVPSIPTNRRMPFGSMTNPQDKPKSKTWVNIGYDVKIGDEMQFVNLPLGLPIDTMEAAPVQGQNIDWVKRRTAQNQLLQALKDLGVSMAPGEEKELNLKVKLRRVNEELSVSKEDNEYAVDLNSLLAVPAAQPQLLAAE